MKEGQKAEIVLEVGDLEVRDTRQILRLPANARRIRIPEALLVRIISEKKELVLDFTGVGGYEPESLHRLLCLGDRCFASRVPVCVNGLPEHHPLCQRFAAEGIPLCH